MANYCPWCTGKLRIVRIEDQYADDISWPDFCYSCSNCGHRGPILSSKDEAELTLEGPDKVEIVQEQLPSGNYILRARRRE